MMSYEQLLQKSFTQFSTAFTIYDVIKSWHTNYSLNFPPVLLISATLKDRRREDLEADQNGKKDISLSLTLSYTCYGGEKGMRGGGGGGGVLLLKESCHFDSHHQGNGREAPQSSALSFGGGGVYVCVAAVLYLCKPTSNTHTQIHKDKHEGLVLYS